MKFSKRHLAKTISWRFIGTLDTMVLSWFISGDLFLGLKMFAISILSSIVLVVLIMSTKNLLDWAIESSEDLLSEKIKQLHAEMDAIINQFKKDSTIAE